MLLKKSNLYFLGEFNIDILKSQIEWLKIKITHNWVSIKNKRK